jgi:hypothetical protein
MSSYKVSEPSALKFLKANGTVVDENGNVVNDATDYWKQVYDQAEPKVAKYLHSDGTIDENPGSGSSANSVYCWTSTIGSPILYTNFATAPKTNSDIAKAKFLLYDIQDCDLKSLSPVTIISIFSNYEYVSETEFRNQKMVFVRDGTKDFTLWEES